LTSTEGLEIIPIEIRNQGTKSIVQYILDLCQSPNSNPLYRTKLMVVGYENVGKTTILDCLFPITDLGETKGKFQNTEYLIELQGKYFRRYKPKELDKIYKEIILENKQWNVKEIKETGLELIPLIDKSQKKIEIHFKNKETRDKWIERLKRVILNSATHGIEIQNQILQNQDQNKLSNVSELVKSLHSSSDQLNLTPNIDVSIWDFAGQHDYYNNHHYFLSTRTVFLVLWKMKDEKVGLEGLKFWFKSLSSHLQHDPTSLENNKPYFSILVVGTFLDDQNVKKSEESKKFREQEILEIAKSNRIHYPIQIYEVSCSTMDNIHGLKQSIYKTALTHGYMGEKLPIGYLNIKNSIEELKNQEKFKNLPIIEIQELINYNKTFEFDDEFVKRGLKLLHQWGTCVYFDEPKELSNYVVLKPEFLTKEVMGKLFSPDLRHNFKDGILNHSNLKLFWPNYMDKSEMLMTLMEKFEICFKLKEDENKPFKDQRSLIVNYSPENKPNDLSTYWPNELSNKNEEIERTMIFNMIPKEMVSRLFVCLQHKIEDQLIWRYGMAFISKENKNIRAFVNVETELIDQNGIERKNSISTANNHKGNDQIELKNNDQFKIKNQIIIKVRGENLKDRKEIMDNIVEEIWKCSKKYSGIVCYQMISSPFDSTSNGLIQLSDCLLEITKPKDKQGILCPTTKKMINPIDLLLKSGMIYQREVIEEKKKEIEEAIKELKDKNNLDEDQTQELLHHPQLISILMSEILKNEYQDSDNKKNGFEINEDISIRRNQKLDQGISKKDSENNGNNEDNEVTNIPNTRNQSQNESQIQELTQKLTQISQQISSLKNEVSQGQNFTNNKIDSAQKAIIHRAQQQNDREYPSYYLLLPLMKEQSTISTSKFQNILQKTKEKAKDLIFNRSQLHCFCEFKVRSAKNCQPQPLFHPTNSPGKIPFFPSFI